METQLETPVIKGLPNVKRAIQEALRERASEVGIWELWGHKAILWGEITRFKAEVRKGKYTRDFTDWLINSGKARYWFNSVYVYYPIERHLIEDIDEVLNYIRRNSRIADEKYLKKELMERGAKYIGVEYRKLVIFNEDEQTVIVGDEYEIWW